ncbi:hypothetical protein NZD89_19790 [Alicyclobacillus fastidiosus]|uniref:Xanthine/uracil/vitamin C permease n=1 Tax=Alicyclobacillus fastidiosus TaxID=392011 RepID=A0ABY6ZCB5_9BACL|nr:hypothetical protein [Alicyclobacillus fastidiosus]WAH40538.1 hypothetical protein NZD89_19790 [Alicyclobacillus fastidiosus]GMA61970.1 hypothetical protein GCM10025859_24100 [Alicyclobacillus fastidiosus]
MNEHDARWKPYWFHVNRGDMDAMISHFGVNITDMAIPALLLAGVGIPLGFSVDHMLPGFSLGFLLAGLWVTWSAHRLARRTGARTVTSQVFGINVPSSTAFAISIMLPVYQRTHSLSASWAAGAAAVVWMGIFKLASAPFTRYIRKLIPKPAVMTVFAAAMYSYLSRTIVVRLFSSPLLGIIALTLVLCGVFAKIPLTKWSLSPFFVAWMVVLVVGLTTGDIHISWSGMHFTAPWHMPPKFMAYLMGDISYFSVIVPMSVYAILQDLASVEAAQQVGDEYSVGQTLLMDGVCSIVIGVSGGIIPTVMYAVHPSYKHLGARISYHFWVPIVMLLVVMAGLSMPAIDLFPWSLRAAVIAYVSIGVGRTAIRNIDHKYVNAFLLGIIIPGAYLIQSTMQESLAALKIHLSPHVSQVLDKAIYWDPISGMANGFLLLVLVITAISVSLIDRKFLAATLWSLFAALSAWLGLMNAPRFGWGEAPDYALAWLVSAVILLLVWVAAPKEFAANRDSPADEQISNST